jgi:predicted MFS family arabinose efflux permease
MPEPISPKKRLLLVFVFTHSVATAFYQYGEPFFAAHRLHWSAPRIALMEVMRGLVIAAGAWTGGQVADRLTMRGSTAIGLAGAAIGLIIGLAGFGHAIPLLVAVAIFNGFGSMVWPASEAALMAGEDRESTQHLVAYYNITWSIGTATAVFGITAVLKGLGEHSYFVLPIVWYLFALCMVRHFIPNPGRSAVPILPAGGVSDSLAQPQGTNSPAFEPASQTSPPTVSTSPPSPEGKGAGGLGASQRAAFRWLGWLANPLAYFAINVVNTLNPTVVTRLGLGAGSAFASAACSVWFFVRAASFEMLRRWDWWHYKWRFLCLVFAIGMVAFTCIELAPNIGVFLVAQVVFGLFAGLIYQSSLFYSMAGSDTQGAHGGAHEAFIGIGTMFGPLVYFLGTRLAPGMMALPIAAVLAMMLIGEFVLYSIGRRTERPS